MPDWHVAAQVDDVWTDAINPAVAGGTRIVLVRAGDDLCAYHDACPHEKFPLSEWGVIENGVIVCNRHFWEFELGTGTHISRIERPNCDLARLPVRVEDGAVLVDIEPPAN